jgi:hypothetical protein
MGAAVRFLLQQSRSGGGSYLLNPLFLPSCKFPDWLLSASSSAKEEVRQVGNGPGPAHSQEP